MCDCRTEWGYKAEPLNWMYHYPECQWRLPIAMYTELSGSKVYYHKGLNRLPELQLIEVVWDV